MDRYTRGVKRIMTVKVSPIDSILDRYSSEKGELIQILLEVQQEYGWIPPEAIQQINQQQNIPLSLIYRVATFYKGLSLLPKGRHTVSICVGTACHVRGASPLLHKVMDVLNISPGATSRDMRFSLDTVNCLGCCALGPVMVVDGVYYSNPGTTEIEEIASNCE